MLGTWVLSDNIVDEYYTAPESIELLPNGVCHIVSSRYFSSNGNWVWFRRNNIVLLCDYREIGTDGSYKTTDVLQKCIFTIVNGSLRYYDDHNPWNFGEGSPIRPDRHYNPKYRNYIRTKILSNGPDGSDADNSDLIGRWETQRYTPEGTSIIVYQFLEFREDGQHSYGQYSSTGGASIAHYTHSDYLWVRREKHIIAFRAEPHSAIDYGFYWDIGPLYIIENGRIPHVSPFSDYTLVRPF